MKRGLAGFSNGKLTSQTLVLDLLFIISKPKNLEGSVQSAGSSTKSSSASPDGCTRMRPETSGTYMAGVSLGFREVRRGLEGGGLGFGVSVVG